MSELPGNLRATNFDRLALDFNHNTVPKSEAYRGEPAKIAATATPLVFSGEGIVFDDVQWTEEGREYVGGKHYIDLSPAVLTHPDGEIFFIHSAAVCRQGCIPDLTLFSADPLSSQLLSKLSARPMDFKALICSLLGLDPATVTDQELSAGVTALIAALKQAAAANQSLTTLAAEVTALKGLPAEITALKALSSEVTGLRSEMAAKDRAHIIEAAAREGKVIPPGMLSGDNSLDNTKLRALCAELPVTVPLERRTVTHLAAEAGVIGSTAELEVFNALGLTKEQVLAAEKKAGIK